MADWVAGDPGGATGRGAGRGRGCASGLVLQSRSAGPPPFPDSRRICRRPCRFGASPTGLYAELHAVAAAAFDAIAQNLIPGARAGDLAAAGAVIEQAGFTAVDDLVHGFGGGYLPPVVPAPGRPAAAPNFVLAAGMTLVVQPNVVTRDGHAGVQTGELLLVTEQGPQRLHTFPQGLQQVG